MEQQIIENGGLQYVPQIAVQYVYLDFDGELTSYNGEILTIDNVEVQDSSLTGERIADIVAELNARYAAQNVIFLTERPETAEYSTIYIGKTSAFDEYGNFAGLAETIDEGNQIKNDNAFVMLDSTAGDAQIISTISHETDHLLGTLDHGGEGLNTYARKILVNTKNNEVPIQYIYNTQGYNSCEEEISVIVWCIENSNKKQVYQGNFKTKKETRKYGTTYYWLPKNYITINVADFVKELPDIIDETITLSVGYDYNPELNAVNTLGTFFLKFVDRIFDQEKNRTNGVIDAKENTACFIAAAVNALDFFKKINDGDYEKLVEYYGTKASTLGGDIGDVLKSGGLEENSDYNFFSAAEFDKIQNWLDNGYAVLMHHSGNSAGMGHIITIDSISGNEVKYTDSDDGKYDIRNGNIKIDNNKYIFTDEKENKYEITRYTVINNGDNWSINTLLNKKNVHSEVSMSSAGNITIGTGGKVNFNGPSTISGYIDMYDGGSLEATAAVTGTSDSEINISLAYDSPGSQASIYNLNNFSDINVSITVDGHQKHGEYLIATNASGFDRDISLKATYIAGNMRTHLLNPMPSANFETFDEISMSIGSIVTNGNGVYKLFLDDENNLILKVAYRSILNDNMAPDAPHLFSTEIFGYDATLSWQAVVDNGDAGTAGYYVRYGMTQTLNGEGVFVAANEFKLTNLAIGNYYYQVKSIDAAENISEWSAVQSFEVSSKTIVNLYGSVDGVSWDAVPGIHDYIVQYSKDNFINTLQLETNTNSIDTFGLPAGTYQWRVKAEDGEFFNGENIVSDDTATPQIFVSDDNGDMDLFFGNANGTWEAGYAAEHQGFRNGWTGTKERISLTGKNKIADVFSGSDDANVLVLTDDINGDALFVEDIYTSFGKDAARISQIDEIRAGSGDDIIDMTSQKFAYTGEEMTIRGGLGNDVIWAAGGDNDLFGDAGNDRIIGSTGFDLIVGGAGNDSMHTGGGGNDIFAFCENWGQDTVQLTDSDSYIALWFASGSESNWDAAARIYSDGSNSVTVIGGAGCTIDLKFGDEGGQYDDMVSIGAFESATSEKIFEDKNSGMLA